MKPQDVAAYLFLALAWGLSFLVLLKVVHAFGWVGAVTFRSLLAGSTLIVAAAVLRRRLDFSVGWQPFATVGASTVAAQLIGLSYATPLIGTAMAAILVATIPLFSMIISQFWGLERISAARLGGLLLGFLGIVLLVGFPAVPATGQFIFGCLCSLFSSFAAAFGSNYASHRLKATSSWEVTAGSFLFGGLMTLPLLIAVPVPSLPEPIDYLYLLILGGGMSALTYVTYFWLVSRIGATRAISVEFAVTFVAMVVGAILLDETLSATQIVGAAIIVLGCSLVLGLLPGTALLAGRKSA